MPIAITWESLSQKTYPPTQFLIDPYIPQGGTILLYGKSSIGKSPTTWEMARAIGSGGHFFGLPAKEGRVLYIEVDTPEMLVASRLRAIPPAPNVWWEFMEPLSLPHTTAEQDDILGRAKESARPDVVFINTLRKVHDLDDKDSRAPKFVYSFFRHLFPLASLVFVHHMRKSSPDPKAIVHQAESFSGSNHWLNDAQTGLHLEAYSGGERENLRLYHIKSQVSRKIRPLPLFLDTSQDASLSSPLFDELLKTYEFLNELSVEGMREPAGVTDSRLGDILGVAPTTAKKRRLDIETGRFPGSALFLS